MKTKTAKLDKCGRCDSVTINIDPDYTSALCVCGAVYQYDDDDDDDLGRQIERGDNVSFITSRCIISNAECHFKRPIIGYYDGKNRRIISVLDIDTFNGGDSQKFYFWANSPEYKKLEVGFLTNIDENGWQYVKLNDIKYKLMPIKETEKYIEYLNSWSVYD